MDGLKEAKAAEEVLCGRAVEQTDRSPQDQ